MKMINYFAAFWACQDMQHHTHLKLTSEFNFIPQLVCVILQFN